MPSSAKYGLYATAMIPRDRCGVAVVPPFPGAAAAAATRDNAEIVFHHSSFHPPSLTISTLLAFAPFADDEDSASS
jgi:hypothetical protein